MQIAGISIIVFGAIILYLLLRPVIRGAPYFTTKPKSLEVIIRLADARPSEFVADLGSGDGRIIMAFAKQGIEAHGFEINPLLVWISRCRIKRAGLEGKAFIHWKSFWRADLSWFDVVVVYGITRIMRKLGEKLEKELKPGTKVISNIYRFPGMRQVTDEGRIFLYQK